MTQIISGLVAKQHIGKLGVFLALHNMECLAFPSSYRIASTRDTAMSFRDNVYFYTKGELFLYDEGRADG